MSTKLILVSALFSIFVIIFILYLIKKERINIKYAIIWLLLFGILFISLLIPGIIQFFTSLFGFQMSSNMIFSILIGFLVIISISLTAIVSSQDRKIRLLIQEVSTLKKEFHKNK